jgi:hypothetical protein
MVLNALIYDNELELVPEGRVATLWQARLDREQQQQQQQQQTSAAAAASASAVSGL